jgi:large repetitive protein
VQRYGPFDLYAMGLLAESEVPRAFYVEDPTGAGETRDSPPRTGIGFSGTRREVSIEDVVAAMGPRNPPSSGAPRFHRQAWVYVVGRGRTADPAAIAKLETIRRAFEGFFASATGGRMSVETRLD